MSGENGGGSSIETVDNAEAIDKPESTTIKYEIINKDVYNAEEMNQDESISIKRPSSTNQFNKGPNKRTKTKEDVTAFKSDSESEDKNSRKSRQSEVFIFLGSDNEDIPLIRLD